MSVLVLYGSLDETAHQKVFLCCQENKNLEECVLAKGRRACSCCLPLVSACIKKIVLIELKMRCVEASHAVRGSFSLCLHPDHEGR